ncbi:MAG: RIP metalloprotease RseP [Candidatus Gastranaerophilales bacterium]|nr:RIP metalloprotease RseP [Candidatus Gastranaerophilales bacterium]
MSFLHMFLSAIIMILLISLLILIHELGHFLAAKAVGMRVDKFGFGLPVGPTLFSKKIGETQILIHAFLLGGYVSFPDDEEDCDLPKDSPLRFSNKTVGQRSLVISAGVIFNVILAYALIFFTGLIWGHLPDNSYTVTFEKFAPSAVESVLNSGLQQGDKIYTVNGTKVIYPLTLTKYFVLSKEFDGYTDKNIADEKLEELKLLNPQLNAQETIKAGTQVIIPEFQDEKPVKLSLENILGIEKYNSNEIPLSDLQKNLRDKINYNNTYKLDYDSTLEDIAYAISDTKKPVSVTVLRNNEEIELKNIYPNKEGMAGIEQSFSENYKETKTFKQLIDGTCNYVNYTMGFMVTTLLKLFEGKIPMSEMNGIIAITKIGTEIIAYKGIFQGFLLAAMISLNLALINILPVPALDGGHLLFLIIEKITGKPVSKKFVEGLSNFFFYLLVALMVLIIFNDIHAWVIGKI